MDYKKRFIAAHKKSSELGLNPEPQALPFAKEYSKQRVQKILQACADYLYSCELETSSDLATNCIPIHMQLQAFLREHLSVRSSITIGDKFWKDYVYCHMSYQDILEELQHPMADAALKAHVWLTLGDGSVLDCTGEAHMDLLFNRSEHPTHECFAFVRPSQTIPDGYYRPYLVGSDFLERTGAFAIVSA
ncbi:hypothetical protein ABA45_02275 [Marinobacter psychrophilus]|uniref:Uncharacterized protein n=1 Tax=Marinobacter psychrophilus TaxID=330734 RepID=A0A0H4HXK1_9GAMM|nr:hypothetical protein [Marinobacter psychrophilus]AKO51386.1 hypothetical protein ABA45_02275 [Marinobacter psychrophilus]